MQEMKNDFLTNKRIGKKKEEKKKNKSKKKTKENEEEEFKKDLTEIYNSNKDEEPQKHYQNKGNEEDYLVTQMNNLKLDNAVLPDQDSSPLDKTDSSNVYHLKNNSNGYFIAEKEVKTMSFKLIMNEYFTINILTNTKVKLKLKVVDNKKEINENKETLNENDEINAGTIIMLEYESKGIKKCIIDKKYKKTIEYIEINHNNKNKYNNKKKLIHFLLIFFSEGEITLV